MKNKYKKDILFLCQFFYPEYVSSATLPYDTALELVKNGYSVGALCGYPKEYNQQKGVPIHENVKGIDIHRLRYLQMKRSNFLGRLINYFSFTFSVLINLRKVKDFKMIFVYSNPPILPVAAVIAKKLFGNKIVFMSYDVYPEIAIASEAISENGMINSFIKMINKLVFANVDKVVAVASDMEKYLVNNRKLKNSKALTIPNWYKDMALKNLNEYDQSNFKDIPNSAFVVSYLGNLGTCQELDTLLNTIRLLKDHQDIIFVFAGHGNKMEQLKQTIMEEKLANVRMYGFLHGDDFDFVLCRSDVFVVTLIPGLSGLCAPSKTCSYMMAGKPIIAVMDKEMEIAQDLTDNEAGFVIDYDDCNKMKDVILNMKDNLNLRNRIGYNARNVFISKYEISKCMMQYQKLVKEELEV